MIKYKHTAEDWMDRIEEALDFRKVYGIEDVWHQLEMMYMNLPGVGYPSHDKTVYSSRLPVG
jgi:hypothetical protein